MPPAAASVLTPLSHLFGQAGIIAVVLLTVVYVVARNRSVPALEQAAARGLRGRCITPRPGTSAMNPVVTVMTAKNLQNTSNSGNKATTAATGPSGAARGPRLGYFGRGW